MKKMDETIFSAATVALPPFAPQDAQWESWSVIACDQFTSEPAYWEQVQAIAGDSPSAYHLILPEAYLGTEQEARHRRQITEHMEKLDDWLCRLPDTLIYLERTLPDGKIRRGLIGKFDLEAYDYHTGSGSFIRATEATVLERIPPRCAIRQASAYELPHVMAFYTDPEQRILQPILRERDHLRCVYQTRLMLGGGFAAGYALEGAVLRQVLTEIALYEAGRRAAGGLGYAIGDGNHSLAAAKAHYENQKKRLGEAAGTHASRYALVELVSLEDEAIQFEPIYRLVTGCAKEELLSAFSSVVQEDDGTGQQITVVTAEGKQSFSFRHPTHSLTVGTLQDFLDSYKETHPQLVCDYIHGEASLCELAKAEDAVGFLFAGMKKEELFPYVEQGKVLPRKTFSMGEAKSKRYYLELRKIEG